MLTATGRQLRPADDRRRAPRPRAEARPADRSERPARVHRHLHRHRGAVRDQQRERLVRGLDDPRPHACPTVAPPRGDDAQHAQFGTMLQADADLLGARWAAATTCRGRSSPSTANAVRFPSESDHFPDAQTNVVPIQLSMGAYNALQQSDAHSYWEFNYTTNWIHPLYELPFTGGIPRHVRGRPRSARLQSIVPGPGPAGTAERPGRRSATTRSCRAIPTSSTATTTRSASSASASSRAASPTRSSSTPTSGWRRSSPARPTSRSACSTPTRPRSRASTERRRRHLGGRRRHRHGVGRLRRQRAALPPGDVVQPLRGDPRDQRRPAGAALRAEPERLGADRAAHAVSPRPCRPRPAATATIADPRPGQGHG